MLCLFLVATVAIKGLTFLAPFKYAKVAVDDPVGALTPEADFFNTLSCTLYLTADAFGWPCNPSY